MVISAQFNNYFAKNNILSDCQHGFHPDRSAETALLCQKEPIIDNVDAGKLTWGIFIDYCLNHDILIRKLDCYSIRGVENMLFRSYLSGQMQCVAIEKFGSSYREIKLRVPQGSVFIVSVNDITEIVSDAYIVLYWR